MTWVEANQRYLTAALHQVRAQLERHANATPSAIEPPVHDPSLRPAIEIVTERFGLSPFERAILLLCAGVELDAAFAALCATPTFSLALAALEGAHWSAVTPEAPLRRWKLIDVRDAATSLVTAPVAIDERVLHFLTGIQQLDPRLHGAMRHVPFDRGALAESHATVAARITGLLAPGDGPVIQLCGPDTEESCAIAAAAADALQLHLLALDADAVPRNASELETFLTLCNREAILTASAVFLDTSDVDASDVRAARHIARIADRIAAPLILGAHERWRALRRRTRTFDVARPSRDEQLAVWREAVGPAAESLNGDLERVAMQFDLRPSQIHAAAGEALESDGDALADALWHAGRAAARPSLDTLAQRIESSAARHDLVLPDAELRQLYEIATQVAHRATVYERWGFGRLTSRGLGISALFSGASGTGKTLAAEVLANELRLDLYRIDLSAVVSKYVGETEKNLRSVFDAAESGGAILFFDEADALFGKRGEVRDSHDRYANIEINYLLQRMESYRGLAILATNRKADLDPAFLRRIRFVVNFPFPDQAMRQEIWARVFPREVPLDGLDFTRLARMSLSGGNIRNVAMSAAFLAAAAGRPVAMEHLLAAAQREHAKLERPLMEGA